MKEATIKNQFIKFVSQNILGMIGLSFYIIADTFFISKANGANGITALNLVLPLYNLIFAIGAMIGVGSAIRYTIAKSKGKKEADHYFGNAIFYSLLISLLFILSGLCIPDKIVAFLGGNDEIIKIGAPYTRIFMVFTPFFMWNQICNAFVRNDNAPSVAMAATLLSSLFNIVMDYVLMFPLGMGMSGAALATACSPIVGIMICCIHLLSKKSTVILSFKQLSLKRLLRSSQLGISAFVGEISSGVITIAFNMIILKLVGNIGVAAYGIVANISLVVVSVFNGIAQGSQPLISENFGKGKKENVLSLLKMSVLLEIILAVVITGGIICMKNEITNMFNGEGDALLTKYAHQGLILYSLGFIFAGLNIVGGSFLSAITAAKDAFIVSIMRGFVAILICAFVMSALFKMPGVWLAFPTAEIITLVATIVGIWKYVIKNDRIRL